jgi:hypothetical protein
MPSCPYALEPQQYAWPLESRPQVCWLPALMLAKDTPPSGSTATGDVLRFVVLSPSR